MVDARKPVVSVAAKLTLAAHCPSALFTVMLAGQTMTGARSVTVTSNEQIVLFPAASVTVKVFVVVPLGKVEPLARPAVWTVVGVQLSVPTGAVYVTAAPAGLVAVALIFARQVIEGASSSVTVMSCVQVAVLPAASVAVQVTVVVPTG